jgi:ABC-type transport system substrate-binding protein
VPTLAACGGGGTAEVATVTPEQEEEEEATDEEDEEATDEEDAEATDTESDTAIVMEDDVTPTPRDLEGSWETPHPIIGDINFRKGFAHCADREELIQSVYPFLTEGERQELLMDTFLPQGHWALAPEDEITSYPFDPEAGIELLEQAGWTEIGSDGIRMNEDGDRLSVNFTTTNAQFRQTWATVLEQQLRENCGIEMTRLHAPADWWFGDQTGLQVRNFELGAYAWVGEADPGGETLYGCNQIPLPSNNWEGQNYMGWCNEDASRAIFLANNRLNREDRVEQYTIVQREFTEDMISLPMFNRLEAEATSNNLLNFVSDPTVDSYVASIDEWEMADGGDTVVLGFTQEPASLWMLVESAMVANTASSLMVTRAATSYSYDYQPVALNQLPTIENGGTVDEVVEVAEGDIVWTTAGEAVELAPGVEVVNADGEVITFQGEPIEMRQLTVTFEFVEGLTWEDGEPVTAADMQLAHDIECDPESGATTYALCDSIENVDFPSDTSYVITYRPGARWAEYFVQTLGIYSNLFSVGAYPAHRELSEESLEDLADQGLELEPGSTLADVPAKYWASLVEVAEQPFSYGPYRIISWEKGQRMTFEANPHYYKGEPPIKSVVIQFYDDTNAAVAALITGSVDVLGTETLGAGPELQTVFEAGEAGQIQAYPFSSPTWEHVDFNLFIP